MPDRVDVPALLRRSAARVEQPNWYMPDPEDAVFLDRLADAVEAWHVELRQDYDRSLVEQPNAGLRMLALLRGEVAP